MENNEKEKDKLDTSFKGKEYTNVENKPKEVTDISVKKPSGKRKEPRAVIKKSLGEKIAENFLATDKEEVENKIIYDFIIPGIKSLIEELVHLILYGQSGGGRIIRERGETRPRRVLYENKFDERRRDEEYVTYRPSRKPQITFIRESDANQVLGGLCEYIDDYERVTLKEFYSIISEVTEGDIDVPTSWTMTKYGWYDVSSATIVKVRGGWCLRMPKAEVLER